MQTILVDPGLIRTGSRTTKRALGPARGGFINLGLASAVVAVLGELRTDPRPILDDAGLSHPLLKDRHYRFSATVLGKLLPLCVERTHCPHFALLVGAKVTLSALGELGPLMKVSETFGDALRVLETYRRLHSSGAVLQLARAGDQVVLSYLPYEGEAGAGLIAECALASLTYVLRELGGPDWALTDVLIPRRAPADQGPYRSFFRSWVRFDQEAAALIFPAKLLSMRLVGSDAELRRALEHNLQIGETKVPPELVEDLRQMLRTEMSKGRCSADDMARHLGLHKRTLHRHLKAAGTGFRTVADGVRFDVARQLVADTDIPLAQISAALDFSEPAAFTRAFQRWSGISPSELRSQQKAA